MSTNLARATKVIDRTAEKVGTRAPLLARGRSSGRICWCRTPRTPSSTG